MKKIYVLLTFLIFVGIFIPTVSANEYNEYIEFDDRTINIYDEAPPKEYYFEKPSTKLENVNLIHPEGGNYLRHFVIHRDIGDLHTITVASDRIIPTGYDRVDRVAADFYCDTRLKPTSSGFPAYNLAYGNYVGSGHLYVYSNSETNQGHLTIIFDSWDSSVYQGHEDQRILIMVDAERALNFSSIKMGTVASPLSTYQPINDDVVCSFFATAGGSTDSRYGNPTYVYTKSGVFRNTITYHKTDVGHVPIVITRNIDGVLYPSNITITSTSQGYTYLTDNTVSHTVGAQLPLAEAPFKIDIYSPLTDKTYTYTLHGDSQTDPTDDPDESATLTVYVKNSQTGALIADANVIIDALVDGEYYPVTNRTEPSGIFSITLQPTGGGQPNPDGYRLIVTADGYNNPMPEINFTVDDYKQSIYCLLDPIAGGPVNENKTFIDFFVRDMASNPISGATVKFGKYTLITNSQGYTVFEVDKNNNYTWTISKSGYGPLTGNAVIGDAPRHTINTVLAPIVTPTTTTPIPTSPSIGPTPTMTAPTGEHVSNWLEWFAAHFGMILGGGVEIGKIFMWLCFTVPVGVYVGKEAKAGAAGFMAGAGIVTLFFVLIGWVPIWLVVLLALIIGLLYAKEFNAPDNGGGR
ncbi:MAG: carboxypeptidase-like regulatory domain-containing protein [Bacteroidales bacterium]|nr:carboxypeptidase-like regulatory domain-containing protein [Bacteroidales bacterium]